MTTNEQNLPLCPKEPRTRQTCNDWKTDKTANRLSSYDILWEFLLNDNAKYLCAFQKTPWKGSIIKMSRAQVAKDAHNYLVSNGVETRTISQVICKLYDIDGIYKVHKSKTNIIHKDNAKKVIFHYLDGGVQNILPKVNAESSTQATIVKQAVINNSELALCPDQSGNKRTLDDDTPEKPIKVKKVDEHDIKMKRIKIRIDAFIKFADKQNLDAEERDNFIKKILDDELN